MSARRSQAAMSMARKKCAQAKSNKTQSRICTDYILGRDNASVSLMQLEPEHQQSDQHNYWQRFTTKEKSLIVIFKLLDTLLSFYTVGVICYGIYLNYIFMISQDEAPEMKNESTIINKDWKLTNIEVLGSQKWIMTSSQLILLFSIFHAVYGLISSISDISFFHSLASHNVLSRYINTILPVQRLFNVVVSCMDGLIIASSDYITSIFGDIFPVIFIIFLGLVVFVDTLLVLVYYRATHGKRITVFVKPWRNLLMMLLIVMMVTYSLVKHQPNIMWDSIPIVIFSFTPLFGLGFVIYENSFSNKEDEMKYALTFLIGLSCSNVLGLFSVHVIMHQLIFN